MSSESPNTKQSIDKHRTMKTKTKIIDFKLHNLNQRAEIVHKIHEKWWQDTTTGERIKRDPHELLLLVITELAEATEGCRRKLKDDKLKKRWMEEVEMADTYIRLLDFAGGFKFLLHASGNGYPQLDKALVLKTVFLFELVQQVCRIADDYDLDDSVIAAETLANGGPARYQIFPLSKLMTMIELYCGKFGLDLEGAVNEKLAFNMKRKDHTHAARRGKNGKAF